MTQPEGASRLAFVLVLSLGFVFTSLLGADQSLVPQDSDNSPLLPYLKAVETDPFSLDARIRLAEACLDLFQRDGGSDKEWIVIGMKAIYHAGQIDPYAAAPYLLKAKFSSALGETEKAGDFARAALYFEPQNEEAKQLVAKFGGTSPPPPVKTTQPPHPSPAKSGPVLTPSGGGGVVGQKPKGDSLLLIFFLIAVNMALAVLLLTQISRRRRGTGLKHNWKLLVTSPGESPVQIRCRETNLLIGRDPSCGVRLSGDDVSARHAELSLVSEGILIKDLGSSNGTLVNGSPITSCYLYQGDQITIGSSTIMLEG